MELSKPTFDLFNSLSILKMKNNKIISQKQKQKRVFIDEEVNFNKEEILETLINDIDFDKGDIMSELQLSPKGKILFLYFFTFQKLMKRI